MASEPAAAENAAEFAWQHDDVLGRIASRYDLLCDVFSFDIHRFWKRAVARRIASEDWSVLLDGASGTGDIVLRLLARQETSGRTVRVALGSQTMKMEGACNLAGSRAVWVSGGPMNTTIRSMVVLVAMLGVGACAHEPKACQSSLSMPDVAAAMGEGVAIQPVFSGGGQKGWRLYNIHKSAQLTALAIGSGTMMTHVCGIPASEVFVKGRDICCSVDASREIEVTLLVADQESRIKIKR